MMARIFKIIFKKSVTQRNFSTAATYLALKVDLFYSAKCFEGEQRFCTHYSDTLKCNMKIGIFLPPGAIKDNTPCPVLYLLNGMKSTYETLIQFGGFQRFAANLGICVVSPDTSPRDINVPDHDHYGPGASFYIDATEEPYAENYQMFSYVTKELIDVINSNFPVIKNKQSVCGFSMGGYGALLCYLKNPGLYQSVSALGPPCNLIECKWLREDVLTTYLGENLEAWKKWDPTCLITNYSESKQIEILLDQGTGDEYLINGTLLTYNMIEAAAKKDSVDLLYKERPGYDHAYYFVITFIKEHIEYHANHLYAY